MEGNNNETLFTKLINFVKKNKKNLIIMAIIIVIAYFLIDFIDNMHSFAEGFNKGMNE